MQISQQIDFPSEIHEIRNAIGQFIAAEVKPRHEALGDTIEDASKRYGPDGRYVPEIRQAITEIRQASAKAGFFAVASLGR